jgi:hypothetical protein
MAALFQLLVLIFGCFVAFIVHDGDALKMAAHLEKVLDAKQLPKPRLPRI